MRTIPLSLFACLCIFASQAFAQNVGLNACDLNKDGSVTNADADLAISMSMGSATCTANIMGYNVCNVAVVQRVVNAITGACAVGTPHSVTLNWVASTSANVTGYKVYRGTVSGGPYTLVNTSSVAAVTFVDSGVTSGVTYYYVVTAVDSAGSESSYSNQATAAIPTP
jgi:fibronectin type 3 domain-containing protein